MADDLLHLLERESALLVTRLRVFTPARYAAAALPFPTRAAAARHLAGQLAAAGLAVEAELPELPGQSRPELPDLPDLPDLALPDLIAVTAHDLVAALRATPPERTVPDPGPADRAAPDPRQADSTPDGSTTSGRTAAVLAGDLLAEVLLHRHDLDGAAPGRRVATAVLAVLAPGTPPDRCLAVARSHCPAYA